MRKKIIFLDIDGTLMDFNGELPESARTALCRAKAEGHSVGSLHRAYQGADISGTFRNEF